MYILYKNLLLEFFGIYFRSMSEYMICQIRRTGMSKLPYRGQIPQNGSFFWCSYLEGVALVIPSAAGEGEPTTNSNCTAFHVRLARASVWSWKLGTLILQ